MKDYGREAQVGAGGVISLSSSHLQIEPGKSIHIIRLHIILPPLPSHTHTTQCRNPKASERAWSYCQKQPLCLHADWWRHVQLAAEGGERV